MAEKMKHPFDESVLSGKTRLPSTLVRVELTNAGYSNLFIPINNGFVRPLKKLVGGRYPRGTPEEGGVTYGFGFHCHDDSYGCFTPVVKKEVDGAFFELEFYAPEPIRQMTVRLRAGGNDDDLFATAADAAWEQHSLGELAGDQLHRFKLPVQHFDPDIAFKFDMDASDAIYLRTARIIPFYLARPDTTGDWNLRVSLPLPKGFQQKTFEYAIYEDDTLARTEEITVVRKAVRLSNNPTEAACQWVLNRYASPQLGAQRGAFPLAYYDSFAKTVYAAGQTMWIRPYMVMPLVEIAARRTVDPDLLKGVVDYVCGSQFLETFFPEKRKGYLEYCGTGNFYYGAVAMLWQVTGDERLKERLLRFVGKYMDSQKVHTPMRMYPAQCHNYRGEHLMPTITNCGHEETMHAAVVEAYRMTHDPELLHEAIGERGAGYLEHPTQGAVRVPERFEKADQAQDLYGYYVSLHMLWARSRDAIHYRAEGLIRLYEVTGDEHWVRLASRRASNYLRYIGEKMGNEFLDINFEYPQSRTSQFQSDPSLNTATGGSDGEYFQDIYTAAGLQQHYPMDAYLREKVRNSIMLIASVIRTNTDDPESHGEAWVPHYAWKGDYENKSAGSRIMSPWIAAGALLKAEDAGFRFDDRAAYFGPLEGSRKLVDAASIPENARLGSLSGYFDLPEGEHLVSAFDIRNCSASTLTIDHVWLNGKRIAHQITIPPSGLHAVDILEGGIPGRQNHFCIELAAQSPAKLTLHHRFSSRQSSLYGAGMNEYFGGVFVRRNIVLHNPYAPIAEKSFHDPLKPESFYRALPADEGYETAQESSFVRTWQPFLQLGTDLNVTRSVSDGDLSQVTFAGKVGENGIVIYDDLWMDAGGNPLNGSAIASGEITFQNPSSHPVIRTRKTGELDVLHPECTLPSAVYRTEDGLHADVVNYIGAADFLVEILTEDPLWLGIPVRSEDTVLSFNGEVVFCNHQLKQPNGFQIDATQEDATCIRLRLLNPGKIRVKVSSEARVPGAPAGLAAAWIDPTGISSQATRLWWQPNLETKTGHYNIYRSASAEQGFIFAGWSPEPVFTDFSTHREGHYFYAVTAVSPQGKEGDRSAPIKLFSTIGKMS